jgi:hypothetical protein
VSQVRRKIERKFIWDNKGFFTESFMHGNEETTKGRALDLGGKNGGIFKNYWELLKVEEASCHNCRRGRLLDP